MLPLILITLICSIVCFPLFFTSKGRIIIAFLRMKMVLKQFTKRHKGKLIRHVNVPVQVAKKENDFDHILITTFGIFVIKLIACEGKVYGSKEERTWHSLTKKGKKCEFLNPLLSNDNRIKKVSQTLGTNKNVYSVVVFVKGNIKAINAEVSSIRKLYKSLKAQRKNQLFTKEEVAKYADIVSKYKDEQYANYVALNKCPKCNQAIKLTKNKKSYVLSCTNPDCKYKVKIK